MSPEAALALAKVEVVNELIGMLEEPELRQQMKSADPAAPYTTEAFLLLARKRFEEQV